MSDSSTRAPRPPQWRAEPILETDGARQPFRPLWQSVSGQGAFAVEHFDRVWSDPAEQTRPVVDTLTSEALPYDAPQSMPDGAVACPPDPLHAAADAHQSVQSLQAVLHRPVLPLPAHAPVIDPAIIQREREAGHAEGRSAALVEMRGAIERECEGVRELLRGIQTALADSERFFVPLERLALHLARQIVRGELSVSGQAISRLVEGCLAEIDARGQSLLLRLNPADHDRLLAMPKALDAHISVVRDGTLSPGSVRVEMAEGMVEDLLEHRLDSLSQSLLSEPWSGPRTFEHLPLESGGDS